MVLSQVNLPTLEDLRKIDPSTVIATAESLLPESYHPQHKPTLKSVSINAIISAIRTVAPTNPQPPLPSDINETHFTISLPAARGEPARTLAAIRYECTSKSEPLRPVHVTFHGSGFVIPSLGTNRAFCVQFAKEMGAVVLDVDYRKAPEWPFPSAMNDALDACKWVLSQPDQFDLTRFTIGGFSAGGNLALSAAWQLGPSEVAAVVAFYPRTQLNIPPSARTAPHYGPGAVPAFLYSLFNSALIIPSDTYDPVLDPVLSAAFAPVSSFPSHVYLNCGTFDTVWTDSFDLWKKIQVLRQIKGIEDDDVARVQMAKVRFDSVVGVGHAYDSRKGTPKDLVEKQFASAIEIVKNAYDARKSH
ncbi:Alpha/Beta hydrolase protein [Cladochytrium replicatum]|nr:Alpha/Beta hydrolase protein [Cladochytrium replicatum]